MSQQYIILYPRIINTLKVTYKKLEQDPSNKMLLERYSKRLEVIVLTYFKYNLTATDTKLSSKYKILVQRYVQFLKNIHIL